MRRSASLLVITLAAAGSEKVFANDCQLCPGGSFTLVEVESRLTSTCAPNCVFSFATAGQASTSSRYVFDPSIPLTNCEIDANLSDTVSTDSMGLPSCGAVASVGAGTTGGGIQALVTSAYASVSGGNEPIYTRIYMSNSRSGTPEEQPGPYVCNKRRSQAASAGAVAAFEPIDPSTCEFSFSVKMGTQSEGSTGYQAIVVQLLPGPFEYQEVPPPFDRVIARVADDNFGTNATYIGQDPQRPDVAVHSYESGVTIPNGTTRLEVYTDSIDYSRSDVDGDGRFSIRDANALNSLIGSTDAALVSMFDVDDSGDISVSDVARLYRLVAGGAGNGVFGDLNGNGRVDCDDSGMAPAVFASNVSSSAYRAELDFDLDGDNDALDQSQFNMLSFIDIDFNNNGVFPEDADPIAFFDVLAGTACASCDSIDINGNSVFPEDADVILFFTGIAGGSCE